MYYFTVVQTDNVEAVSHHQNQMVSRDGDLVTPGSPHDGCGTVSTIKMFLYNNSTGCQLTFDSIGEKWLIRSEWRDELS